MAKSVKIGPGCSIFTAGKNNYWYARFNKRGASKIRKKIPLQTTDKNTAIAKAHNLFREWEVGTFDPWHHVDTYVTLEEALGHYEMERGKEFNLTPQALHPIKKMARDYSVKYVREINQRILHAYIYQPHLADATKLSYYALLSSQISWMTKKGYFEKNPMDEIERPRVAKKVPRYWTLDQLDEFLTTAEFVVDSREIHPDKRNPYWVRDAAELIATTGLRKGEAHRLNWDDIFYPTASQRGYILVRKSKSKKPRKVTMLPRAEKLLRRLENDFRISSQLGEAVLKNPAGDARISLTSLAARYKKIVEFSALPSIGLHGLRHTFAVMLVMRGVDISIIKEELGHANIQTTLIYATLGAEDRMNTVYDKFKGG